MVPDFMPWKTQGVSEGRGVFVILPIKNARIHQFGIELESATMKIQETCCSPFASARLSGFSPENKNSEK